jgi:ATP/maltotriose-dependent transcriptional regulator MalT
MDTIFRPGSTAVVHRAHRGPARSPECVRHAVQAVDALGSAKVKSRAIVLAEAALATAIVGDHKLCLDFGSAAAALTREMDVSLAADLLHEVISVVLPYSDSRAIRELLPQLAQVARTEEPGNGEERF